MAKIQAYPKHHVGILAWLNTIVGVVTGATSVLEQLEELLSKQTDKMLRRLLGLAVMYLVLLTGIICLAAGVVLLIIDFTAIPRGVAFTLGGLFLISVAVIFMQAGRK